MQNLLRVFMLTALAGAALAVAVGTASARTFSVSNQSVRFTWRSLEFAGFATIRCPLTLEGSFHSRTIAKVERALIGAITRAGFNQAACTGGRFATFNGTTSPNTLPWHIQYEGFRAATGLPNIEAIRIILSRFRFGLTVSGICTGQFGSATDAISLEALREGNNVTTLNPIEGRNTITLTRTDGGICSGLRLRGSAEVFLLGTTTRIQVTLI
jgi:hypothetical protein